MGDAATGRCPRRVRKEPGQCDRLGLRARVEGEALTYGHHLEQVLEILEEATGISGKVHPTDGVAFPSGLPFLPGAAVKFPENRVVAPDRVGMWVDGGNTCMSMWPCELQPQYKRVYSDPKKVEALIALAHEPGWQLNSNFHLAYRFAAPQQRWYPRRHLAGPAYVRQWIDDLRRVLLGAEPVSR
jgi:hypothetical protein